MEFLIKISRENSTIENRIIIQEKMKVFFTA